MTHQEKELLLRDITCRFPYGLLCKVKGYDKLQELNGIYIDPRLRVPKFSFRDIHDKEYFIEDFKPCLYRISEMTEEHRKRFDGSQVNPSVAVASTFGFDFLNEYKYDHRGLIEYGLALPLSTI